MQHQQRNVVNQATPPPYRVAIAGLGRSGWTLHALPLKQMPDKYKVVAVMDTVAERRKEAADLLGCRTCGDYDDLVSGPDVDLVVVASPNAFHVAQSIRALQAGKHVICEKAMANHVAEADRMIEVSKESGRILTVFQTRRYFPDVVKVREVLNSGKLGRILTIRMTQHLFRRRWDWQTLTKFAGGELYNSGAHYVDLALLLFGEQEPEVFCHLDRALTSGDAEDHAKIVLRAPGAPLMDIELTYSSAYSQGEWFIMGTSGGLRGSQARLDWKYVDWSTMPARPVDTEPTAANREYCVEDHDLVWHEETWERPANTTSKSAAFYDDFYTTLHDGAPLAVTPQQVRRQIAVLEKCRKQLARL